MGKHTLILFFLFLFIALPSVAGEGFESVNLLNSANLARYFEDILGYPYDSHGCLHFTPSDIYLLVKTVPKGIPLRIKSYRFKENDLPFSIKGLPYLSAITNNEQDLQKHAQTFRTRPTAIIVCPGMQRLFIKVDGLPYAQMKALAGPPQGSLLAFAVKQGQPIEWDIMLTTPTDPGNYSIFRSTSHYLSNAYYRSTVVPFGAWIIRRNGKWVFQKGNKWIRLPAYIIQDLARPVRLQKYNYYDVSLDQAGKIRAARWASHDFGKYVLQWTKNGKTFYPEMGYAAGELLYEQIILVKDLVHILTLPGPDDFNFLVSQNKNFMFYKKLREFILTKGKVTADEVPLEMYSYYRLYNDMELTKDDFQRIDTRILKAYDEYENNRLPRRRTPRHKALGLVYYLKMNSEVINKYAYWYAKLESDWGFWRALRIKLREDFSKMGILSQENRQNVLEKWFNERLEFKNVSLPSQAKHLQPLSFTKFFKQEEDVFAAREHAIMRELIRKIGSGEAAPFDFHSVSALNDYNFGLLLNEILGDLYKSHGCMHISPRNIYFLYYLLPRGAQVTIYNYSRKIDEEQLATVPYLANMVNYKEDLDKLKELFAKRQNVKVAVYPSSGMWVIYIKDEPFAKLQVKGGPQTKMYLMQGRDKDGKPFFEDHLAYPTSPGNYYIFKKTDHYLSNIYRPTTMVPMGEIIAKGEDKKWYFRNKRGKWKPVHSVLQADLKQAPGEWKYIYYDPVRNASGEVTQVRWGSHPFGKYAIQISVDNKSMHPELIHSSGDLIMEERRLIDDLIKIFSAPHDNLDECVAYSHNFDLYKSCYDFVNDPTREDLIQVPERLYYKLYFNLPLSSQEVAGLPQDVVIADKILKKKGSLTREETKILINEGIAYRRAGKLKINMQKILGLQFDVYQYVVAVQKYAHHYGTLKKHWKELTALRRALLKDIKNFVIKDPKLLHDFTRELMLKRTRLEKLSQQNAIEILKEMLELER